MTITIIIFLRTTLKKIIDSWKKAKVELFSIMNQALLSQLGYTLQIHTGEVHFIL